MKVRPGWIKKFFELGFKHHEEPLRYFGHNWIRGGGIDDKASFNVVLTRMNEDLSYKRRLKFLRFIVLPLNIIENVIKHIIFFLKMLFGPIKRRIKKLL